MSCLTINMRGPSYLGLTRSISWLLMPSLRRQDISSHDIDYVKSVGPGIIRGTISTIYGLLLWRNDMKCKYMFLFPLKNLARKELIGHVIRRLSCIYVTSFLITSTPCWDGDRDALIFFVWGYLASSICLVFLHLPDVVGIVGNMFLLNEGFEIW